MQFETMSWLYFDIKFYKKVCVTYTNFKAFIVDCITVKKNRSARGCLYEKDYSLQTNCFCKRLAINVILMV
ncbi:MAG TPA: hypothetical protein DCR95_06165 [Desulfobacter sp.]|nr:hypothetical protein [Desulfobacter sp.]